MIIIETLLTIILLGFLSIGIPSISYYVMLENNLQSKKSYKPIVLMLLSIFFVLFIPMIFWNMKYNFFLKRIFESYKNYSDFSIALLTIHSIIQYFLSKSNFELYSKTRPLDRNFQTSNKKYVNFRIIPVPKGNGNYKYSLDKEKQVLNVYDILNSGNGDNLWFPMNEWYSRNKNIYNFRKMPLWNYLSFDENDQKEWIEQLNKFIAYLQNTSQIKND